VTRRGAVLPNDAAAPQSPHTIVAARQAGSDRGVRSALSSAGPGAFRRHRAASPQRGAIRPSTARGIRWAGAETRDVGEGLDGFPTSSATAGVGAGSQNIRTKRIGDALLGVVRRAL
jgi:hypothetical protein